MVCHTASYVRVPERDTIPEGGENKEVYEEEKKGEGEEDGEKEVNG